MKRVVSEAEYGDRWVCWESYGPGEGYFPSCDDLRQWCLENERPPPARAHGTITRGMALDAAEILQANLECAESDENAYDRIDEIGVSNLQAYLDTWCDEFGPEWYEFDGDTEVELDPTEWERAKADYEAENKCHLCGRWHRECECPVAP